MKNKWLMLCAMLLVAVAASAQSAAENFARELAAKSGEIRSIACRFEQVRSMQIMQHDVVQQGDFYYLRPEQILLAFEGGDYIAMTPTYFSMEAGGVKQRMKLQSNPMLKELKRILSASMTGDVEQLAAGFTPTITEQKESYEVVLRPTRRGMANRLKAISMHFDRQTMSLTMLCMEEQSGDKTTYRFFDKRFNTQLDAALFNRE